jgi:hypothetical protein
MVLFLMIVFASLRVLRQIAVETIGIFAYAKTPATHVAGVERDGSKVI